MAAPTGGRRVTAADVARSLGVSRATVGFVLNGTPGQTISESTRKRVLEEAARLGYRPHSAAQALRRGSSKLILLVLPGWPVEFSMRQYLEEASLLLDEAGYTLVTYTHHDKGRTRPLWETLNPDMVFGFVPFEASEVRSMRSCGITKIVPDPDRKHSLRDQPTTTVGPRLQVEHLHERGHRRLAFAATPDTRLSLLLDARLHAAQLTVGRLGVGELDVRSVDHRDESAGRAVRHWAESGVTGVVAYNDDIAAMVVSAAVRADISVPGDLAVIGHDDSPLAAMFLPTISSVGLSAFGLGRHLAELVLHVAADRPLPAAAPDLEATVIARESTAPTRQA